MINKLFNNRKRLFSLIGFCVFGGIEVLFSFLYSRYRLMPIYDAFHFIVILLAIICLCVFLYAFHDLLALPVAVATVCIIAVLFSIAGHNRYFYLHSPNGENTLIVVENTGSDQDNCAFYVKKHLIFKERLDNYYLNIGNNRPFSDKTYNIDWINENEANLTFDEQANSSDLNNHKLEIKMNTGSK